MRRKKYDKMLLNNSGKNCEIGFLKSFMRIYYRFTWEKNQSNIVRIILILFVIPFLTFSQIRIEKNAENIMIELGYCRDEGYVFNPKYMYLGGEAENELRDVCEDDSDYWIYFFEPNYFFIYVADFGYCGSCGCSSMIYAKNDNDYVQLDWLSCLVLKPKYLPELVFGGTNKTHSFCWINTEHKIDIENHNIIFNRVSLTQKILDEDQHDVKSCPFPKLQEKKSNIIYPLK